VYTFVHEDILATLRKKYTNTSQIQTIKIKHL